MSDNEESINEQYPLGNDEDSEPDEELHRHTIRQNLSTLSFEELIKLKEKLGSKVYNETVYGVPQSNKRSDKREIKRVNKNRPREISSKVKPKQIRAILSRNTNNTFSVPTPTNHAPRDPRFDPSCGEFDKITFKQNYQFVNELREQEKTQLQKEYRECTDPDRKKTIKMLILRTDNQMREEGRATKEKQKDDTQKNEIRKQIKQGEKPVYKKKSVKKLEDLVEKYEELKKTNRLQKHIQKRAKKLTVKDRKVMEKIK